MGKVLAWTEKEEDEARRLFDYIQNDLDVQDFTLKDVNEDTGSSVPKRGASISPFSFQQMHLDILESKGCIAKNEDGSYHVCRDSFEAFDLDFLDPDEEAREEARKEAFRYDD